ncbi:hypothetical protein QCA50_019366 [Cerrena zonata]|uniref:Uncharacterized protein n=1 Tax=Cerrena zonata TaxID=2478898 RepID=A0AAW0FF27_9APHY
MSDSIVFHQRNAEPEWYSDFSHVVWKENCVVASNHPKDKDLPAGNGLMMSQDQPFHLALLTHRQWGHDKFWYLCMLPEHPSLVRDPLFSPLSIPFHHLPIVSTPDGGFTLADSIVQSWQRLQYLTVLSYNVLKEKFLPLVPLATTLPPYPQRCGFAEKHPTEMTARKAAHRARKIFLGWLCLLSCTVAASRRVAKASPPAWFQTLAMSKARFPPFWLDKIASSPIISEFSSLVPRRGMAVNMSVEWGFWTLYPVLRVAGVPLWLCFPHGSRLHYKLGQLLFPSKASIDRARASFDEANCSSSSAPGEGSYDDSTDNTRNTADEQSAAPQSPPRDALTAFFQQRKMVHDRREISTPTDASEVEKKRARGKRLYAKSGVYEWIELECYPWYERRKVARADREEVWSSYTGNQRIYDELTDEWDCVADFAPLESVDCTIVGCRDPHHDHEDDHAGLSLSGCEELFPLGDHSDLSCHDTLIEGKQGEVGALWFSSARMDPFLDVLRYRYGLNWPDSPREGTEVLDAETRLSVLKALRRMVQEECIKYTEWQTAPVVDVLIRFAATIERNEMVDVALSDCHVPDEDFIRQHNLWGFTLSKASPVEGLPHFFAIKTVNSSMSGWVIAVETRTSLRETLRRRWGPGNAQLGRAFLERGIPFRMLWKEALPPAEVLPHLVNPIYRWDRWTFSVADYQSYVNRRLQLFENKAVASAALRAGGILWRLALESYVDLDQVTSVTAIDYVGSLRMAYLGSSLMVYDDLPFDIAETVVGVYKVFTGKGEQTADVSWWPKQSTWNASGFNCGHWTTQCEEWFRRRRDAIVKGEAAPRKTKEWHGALKLRLSAMKDLRRSMEQEL